MSGDQSTSSSLSQGTDVVVARSTVHLMLQTPSLRRPPSGRHDLRRPPSGRHDPRPAPTLNEPT
ncbi:hypothetical protein TYRP_022917 [Tyrophagus putrescentiae]|nr:hypothetical protein TYRP_022917 [Tyrophagus putrescentiae]